MRLSVSIICFNEERSIARCLRSVQWADEIIVVDSMSTDDTVEIAKRFTANIYQRPWPGYVEQKNFAISLATGDWILSLDADEEVSQELAQDIKTLLTKQVTYDGYLIKRRSFYQGRWIRHSGFYPDRQLRLFRRGKAYWVGKRVHERIHLEGSLGQLHGEILHYPYGGSIAGQIETVNSFSGLMAKDLFEEGKRFKIPLLIFRPLFKFLEVYLLRLGILDGLPGLIIAVTSAYAVFARYVKLRELSMGIGIVESKKH